MTPDPEFLHQLAIARDAINAALNRAAGVEVLEANRGATLDVERLAEAIQTTILTSPDAYMGPGMGAYRTPWADLTPAQQHHVLDDAKALAAEYERLSE